MTSTANADSSSNSVRLGIREITDADIDPVVNLLAHGFPNPRRYWEVGLGRLQKRSVPPNVPRYGYLLEANGKVVGVILLISSQHCIDGRPELFSNFSSWYVEPAFRSHATQLLKRALTNKQATFLSISPAKHVRPIYEALGFKRYSSGQFLAVPALARNRQSARVSIINAESTSDSDLKKGERQLLEIQASYGCIVICCTTDGQTRPFVFVPRLIKGFIPSAQLAYCRNINDLVAVAGTVGRYLLWHGRPFVVIDANGPISGMPGKYFPDVAPKYYRGATAPRLGDLAETEATVFGLPRL